MMFHPLSVMLLLSCTTTTTLGFSTIHKVPTTIPKTRSSSQLHAIPPEVFHQQPLLLSDILSSTHHLLADAAAITADAVDVDAAVAATAETATKINNGGPQWWQNYLSIFRNTLDFIHSQVDQPLRNVGIDQTWGVSIALFTIAMRSLLVPLSIQQNKSTEYMKALKPYMKEIKEKFKDNENAKNQAIGKLYEDAEQNPLSGCLVSLVQLPVLLGLYRGIRNLAQEGKLNEPFLWIPNLEGPVTAENGYRGMDWLTSGWTTDLATGYPVPQLGWETTIAFLIMPVVLVALQSFTMSTLSPPMDDNMSDEEKETFEKSQVVLKFLPLMIGFFSLQVPAGLTIYWFTTNLFTLTQSLSVRAYFAANPPKIELPDYWDNLSSKKDISEMTPQERREAVEAGLSIGPTMDDLLDEARFHSYVERTALISEWKSKGNQLDMKSIPVELKEWVESLPTEASAPFFMEESVQKEASAQQQVA